MGSRVRPLLLGVGKVKMQLFKRIDTAMGVTPGMGGTILFFAFAVLLQYVVLVLRIFFPTYLHSILELMFQ